MNVVPGSRQPDSHDDGPSGPDLTPVLLAASKGDEKAWRRIVDLYARRVFALAQSRLRNPEVAEEITQSVFATLAAKLVGGGYTEQGKFEPWLFRIATNRIRDEQRRTRRHPVTHDAEAVDRAPARRDESDQNAEQVERLRSAMHQLVDADREIIELRHHGGMSFAQLAEMLGEPIGTLLARHHRALAKLKSLMEMGLTGTNKNTMGSNLGRAEA
jgi:RNA polymerase sigma-70 factor, ECF subfamily